MKRALARIPYIGNIMSPHGPRTTWKVGLAMRVVLRRGQSNCPRLQIIWHYTFEYKNSFLFWVKRRFGFSPLWCVSKYTMLVSKAEKGQQLFIVILYIVSFSLFFCVKLLLSSSRVDIYIGNGWQADSLWLAQLREKGTKIGENVKTEG